MVQPDPQDRIVLRPLSLGELLDRAVTLFVRNFPAFALIGIVYVVPLMVMQYFVSESSAGSYQQLLDQIQHPNRTQPATLSSFPWGWIIALFTFSSVCAPFVVSAYASAVAAVYRGRVPDWRAAYSAGLQHAGSILAGELLCGVAIFVGIFTWAFGFGILVGVAAVLVRASAVLAAIVGIIGGLGGIAWLLLVAVGYLALWFSILAIPVEDAGVGTAFARGFRRIFTRNELGRAVLVCLCFLAIYFCNFLLSAGITLIVDGIVRLRVLDTIAQGVLQLCFLGFFGTLLAVYYFDVRVRREGLDIQTRLDELDASAGA
ncbi:MAG TPA: hypothetical protein VGZ02_13335 [Candidatus Baltobacteraceae bacterium]|jgi:hypothetical protein|nr:hypothetical protein [Candidatus Baltobacteraceae bacterium]